MIRETLAAMIVVHMIAVVCWPEAMGRSYHKTFNGLKAGWEQVQQ